MGRQANVFSRLIESDMVPFMQMISAYLIPESAVTRLDVGREEGTRGGVDYLNLENL